MNERLLSLIKIELDRNTGRSAWNKGVREYALELLDTLCEAISGGYFDEKDLWDPKKVREALLNGADDWRKYSYGGCSLIYDCDIAERLLTASALKRKKGGEYPPNRDETWLDVQARALHAARGRLMKSILGALVQMRLGLG